MLHTAERRKECDVLILTRGGGSLEDLWAFNNEKLARTIFQCSIPVVTGIGHEIDITIADFVADRRAATPSAAAELVSPDQQQLLLELGRRESYFARQLNYLLKRWGEHLLHLRRRMPTPLYLLRQLTQRLDDYHLRTRLALKATLDQKKGRLSHLTDLLGGQNPARLVNFNVERCRKLEQQLLRLTRMRINGLTEKISYLAHNLNSVSPLHTLGRGYAIVQQTDGTLVRKSGQLITGEQVHARFGKGCAELTVGAILPEK